MSTPPGPKPQATRNRTTQSITGGWRNERKIGIASQLKICPNAPGTTVRDSLLDGNVSLGCHFTGLHNRIAQTAAMPGWSLCQSHAGIGSEDAHRFLSPLPPVPWPLLNLQDLQGTTAGLLDPGDCPVLQDTGA